MSLARKIFHVVLALSLVLSAVDIPNANASESKKETPSDQKIYIPIFTSQNSHYAVFRMVQAAFQRGEVTVLDFPNFKIVKREEKNESGEFTIKYIALSKKSGKEIEIAKGLVDSSGGIKGLETLIQVESLEALEGLLKETATPAVANQQSSAKNLGTGKKTKLTSNELYEASYQPKSWTNRIFRFVRSVGVLTSIAGVIGLLDIAAAMIFTSASLYSMPLNIFIYTGFGLIATIRGVLFVEWVGYIIHRFFQHVGFFTRQSQFIRESQKYHKQHHDHLYAYGPAYQHKSGYKSTEPGTVGKSWLVFSGIALAISVTATLFITMGFNFAAGLAIVIYLTAGILYAVYAVNRIHSEFHQKNSPWEKNWYYQWISAMHILHHKYQQKLFTIVFPMMDYLMGTYVSPKTFKEELDSLFDENEVTVSDLINWRHFLMEAYPPEYADFIADVKQHSKSLRKLERILEILHDRMAKFPKDEDAKDYYRSVIDFLRELDTPRSQTILDAERYGQFLFESGDFVIRESPPPLKTPWYPEQLATDPDREDLRQMVQVIREFLRSEVSPHSKEIDLDHGFAKEKILELFKKAGELGLYGLVIPEKYQGLGLDELASTLMAIELGHSDSSFAATVKAHTGIGTYPILLYGSEELKQRYLPVLASGEKISSFALTEPGSGSDALSKLSSIRTTAKLEKNPDTGEEYWVINGSKQWITNGGIADVFVVFAKTGGSPETGDVELSAFVVGKEMLNTEGKPGVSLGTEYDRKMGIRGSSTFDVIFDQVKVPKENLIGNKGDGIKIGMATLNFGRLALGEAVLGGAMQAVDQAIVFAKERKQFKTPIEKFGAIRELIAQMVIDTYAYMENVVFPVSAAVMSGLENFPTEAAIVKYSASEAFDRIVDNGVQVHGGIGYMEDEAANRMYRDSRINRIFEGSNEIQLLLTAGGALKAIQRKWNNVPKWKAPFKMMSGFFRFLSVQSAIRFHKKPLQKEEDLLEMAEYLLDWTGRGLGQRLGKKLMDPENQTYLIQFAKMVVDFYAMKNTLERTRYRLDSGYESEREVLIAEIFVHDAYQRMAQAVRQMHQDLGFKNEILSLVGWGKRKNFPVFSPPDPLKNRSQKIQRIAELTLENGRYEMAVKKTEGLSAAAEGTRHAIGEALSPEEFAKVDISGAVEIHANDLRPMLELLGSVQAQAPPELHIHDLISAVESRNAQVKGSQFNLKFYHQKNPYRVNLPALTRVEGSTLHIYLSGDLAVPSEGLLSENQIRALITLFHEIYEQIILRRQYSEATPKNLHRMAVYDETLLAKTLQDRIPLELRHEVLSPLTVMELRSMDVVPLQHLLDEGPSVSKSLRNDLKGLKEYYSRAEMYLKSVLEYAYEWRHKILVERIGRVGRLGAQDAAELSGVGLIDASQFDGVTSDAGKKLLGPWLSFFQGRLQNLTLLAVSKVKNGSYLAGFYTREDGVKVPLIVGRTGPEKELPDIFLSGDEILNWLERNKGGLSDAKEEFINIWKDIFGEKKLKKILEAKVLYTVDRGVATLTLNRPDKLNVLDFETVQEMRSYLELAKTDPNVKVVLFKGAGAKAFCAGGDMTAVLERVKAGKKDEALSFFKSENEVDRMIHEFPKPTISLADGVTLGGGLGVSRGSQILVATSRSQFAMPETKIGFFPDVGASHFLPQTMGKAMAKFYAMTGENLSGQEALWSGLADAFVRSDQILELEEKIKNTLGYKEKVSVDDVRSLLAAEYVQPEIMADFQNKKEIIERFFGKENLQDIVADLAGASGIPEAVAALQNMSKEDLDRKMKDATGEQVFAAKTLWILVRRSPMSLAAANDFINQYPSRTRAETLEEDLKRADRVMDHPDFIQGITDILIRKMRVPGYRPAWKDNLEGPGEKMQVSDEASGLEDPYLIQGAGDWEKLVSAYRADPDKFWLKRAYEELEWFKKPIKGITETVDAEGHFSFTYFEDGELNASYEILDRQVKRGMGDMPAYTWIGDPADDQGNAEEVRTVTYRELLAMVEKFSNALTEMGVQKGDGITLYTASNTIEAKVARFAAMRIGAVFTPVFPGLSAQELSDRAHQINTKVVLTVNGGFRKGEVSRYKEEVVDKAFEEYIPLEIAQGFLKNAIAEAGLTGDAAQIAYDKTAKEIKGYITIHYSELEKTLDKILEEAQVAAEKRSAARDSIQTQTNQMPSRINNIVVIERVGRDRAKIAMKEGRDVYFGDVIKKMEDEGKTKFEPVHLSSEHPLFVIFTSGTTGKPKGAYHTTGGYLVNISYSMKFAWGVKPGERIFVAADDGWITGNSAMSDAPLLNGMHSFLYEGLPNWPTSDRLWKILSENKINYYKTGVTAVRDFSKGDAKLITKWDLSSIKASSSCAEPLYPYVQAFWEEVILGGRKEGFANFFWRTEDGMFSPFIPHPLGKAQKPDASTVASPWAELKILVLEKDDDGKIAGFREAQPGEVGSAFIRHHPSMIRGLWKDQDRFRDTYWPPAVVIDGKRWHKVGDAAKVDEQGYVTFLGRDDEVINTSGHRIGTQEIESLVGKVDEVRLTSVVGMPHLIKGETPIAFVILKSGVAVTPELDTKIRKAVEDGKGKIARPEEIIYVTDIPQTLSKKILRRFLEIIAAMPRDELARIYQKLQDEDIRNKVINKDEETLTALFGEKVSRSAQTLPIGAGGTAGLVAALVGIAQKREISKTAERGLVHTGDPYDVDFAMYLPREAKDFVDGQFKEKGYGTEETAKAKRHYEMIRRLSREASRQGLNTDDYLKKKLNELGYGDADITAAKSDFETVSAIRSGVIQNLTEQGLLWPLGKPYLPGERLPKYMFAWAIVKDKSGRPVYGQPEDALYEIIAPTPKPGPNELVGYTLYSGITRNIVAAGEDVNVGGFNFHDRDYHISGSDGVFVTAKIGSEVEKAGITKVGEIFNNYSGEPDLLDYRMGYDPMATVGFKIKGYQTPDGTLAQFSRFQGPQLMRKPEVLSLEEASSYNLDLGTVYKAVVDRAGVSRGDHVYVEGAAGGTGHLAVEVAAMQGAVVTGLVSSQDRGEFAKEHGARNYMIRKDPRFKALWQPVPDPVVQPGEYAEWAAAAESFKAEYQKLNDGHLADMINASVGRPTFAANVELLAPGGKLVYYGADKGFSLTFRGKPGTRTAEEAFKKNKLQPGEGVLVYYGASANAEGLDEAAIDAISAAITRKGRVVVLTNTVEQQIYLQKRFGRKLAGIESIESLKANPSFDWPEEMPDLDLTDPSGKVTTDAAKRYHYQEHTLKIIGAAVGRFLRTQDNPTGFPDVIVERSGQNTLGISAWMARPITGRVLYLEDSTDKKFRFYAPDVWMNQKTIDFPAFSILGTHLFNSFQANVVGRKLDTGQLKMATPKTFDWTNAPAAVQELYDGEVIGTNTVRVGAPDVSGMKTEADLYKNWKTGIKTFGTVKVKTFEVAPGQMVAQVVMEGPNLNALNTAMVDSLGQAVDWIAQNTIPRGLPATQLTAVKAVVLTGGGFKSYVAGADIKELQLIIDREEGRELAKKAQGVYARIESLNVPVVSAINGFALGGGTELAMSTHYRVASAKAEMGQPEINLGLIPGFGGTQRLPRLLFRKMGERGLIEASKIILNGRRIPADKAQKLGLVDELAESDSLARAMELTMEYIRTGKGVLADAMAARHQEIKDWDKAGAIEDGMIERDPEIKMIIDQSNEMGRTNAVAKALEAIYAGLRQGITKGLDSEAEAFGDLIVGPNDGRKFIEDFLKKQSPPLPAHGMIEETPEPTIIEVSRLIEEAASRLGYRSESPVGLQEKDGKAPDAIKPPKLDPALESYRSQAADALKTLLAKYGSTLVLKDRPSFDEGFQWDKETRRWVYELSLTSWELIAKRMRDEKKTPEGRPFLDEYLEHVDYWAKGADIAEHEDVLAMFWEAAERDRERGLPAASKEAIEKAAGTKLPEPAATVEPDAFTTTEGKMIPVSPIDPNQWKGKVIIITGGGTGLGKETVLNYAKAGAHVIINGRRMDKLEETAKEIKDATGMDITLVQGDVVEEKDLETLFNKAKEKFGHVDIVINNAGVSGDVKLLPMIPLKKFIYDVMIHLHVWKTMRLFTRLMKEQPDRPGTIINVATYFTTPSRYEKRPYLFRTPYTLAQAMKIALTRLFAREMRGRDIVVAGLNPGPFEGERISTIVYPKGSRIRDIIGTVQAPEAIRKGTEGLHAKRFVTIEEVSRNIMLMTAKENRSSFDGEIVPMGGIDYQVPPSVLPVIELGTQPDLKGRTVVLTGLKESHSKLASVAKGLASAGAKVVIATQESVSLQDELKAFGGSVTVQEVNMEEEKSVSNFFEHVQSMDAVFHITGEPDTKKVYAELKPEELESMIRRYAVIPAIMAGKYSSSALIYQGLKKAGIQDSRVSDFGKLNKLLERELDKDSFNEDETTQLISVIERTADTAWKEELLQWARRYLGPAVHDAWKDAERQNAQNYLNQILSKEISNEEKVLLNRLMNGIGRVWTDEEKAIFQSGLANAKGQIVIVGPEYPAAKDPLEKYRSEIFREAIEASFTSFAAEMGAAKTGIRSNVILPGSLAKGAGDSQKLNRMVIYLSSERSVAMNGLVLEPDERNSAAGWLPSLQGKRAIVTGGARNMGRSIAQKLAAAGANVLIAARTPDALKATAEGIRASGGQATTVEADVSSAEQVKTMVDEAVKNYGGVDLLINNAGVAGVFARTDEIPMKDVNPALQQLGWETTMKINFHGPLEAMARVIPLMRKYGGGTIEQIVTEYHKLPYIYRSIYVGSKAALGALSLAVADKLSKQNIFVSNINPSLIAGERMDLVLRNNINRLRKDGALTDAHIRMMNLEIDEARLTNDQVRHIVETLEAKSETDIPRDVLKPIAWFWTQISLPIEVIESNEEIWGRGLTDIVLYFKLILPLSPPSNNDVAVEAVHVAANREITAKKDRYVSDLAKETEPPIHKIPEVFANIQGSFEGKTALLAAADINSEALEQIGSLIESYVLAGAKKVVVAIPRMPQKMPASLLRHGNQVEFVTLDFAEEDKIINLFENRSFDAAAYVIPNPSLQEAFTDFFLDERVSALDLAAFEEQLKDNQVRRERFEKMHLTGPMILFREAAKRMAETSQINFIAPRKPSIEGQTAVKMLAELVQVRNEEKKILRKGIHANIWNPQGRTASEVAQFIVATTSGRKGSLDGKVALITGGGKNMGKAIAQQLALEGARVVITGREEEALRKTVHELKALGLDADYVVSDVSKEEDVDHQIKEVLERYGKINILVNNAGIAGRFALIQEIPLETPDDGNKTSWNTTMAIDFIGSWFATVKAVRAMRKLGIEGSVIDVSTFYADQPYLFRGIYTIPKILLKALTKILAGSLRDHGIHMMDIRPSLIKGERMDLVIKGNLLKLKALNVIPAEFWASMDSLVDVAVRGNQKLRKTMEELQARPKDIPPELVKSITWFWMMLSLDEKEIQKRKDIPQVVRKILLNFKKMIPLNPPSNPDVARKVLFLAQNASNQSGQEHFVSSLAPNLDDMENRTIESVGTVRQKPVFYGGTVLLSSASRDREDLKRLEKMAQTFIQSGIKKIIFAVPADFDPSLVQKVTGWGAEVQWLRMDNSKEEEWTKLFEESGELQAAVHVTGLPEKSHQFLDLPLHPDLADLDDKAFKALEKEYRVRMENFVSRYITGSLLFAREASKKLVKGGAFTFVAPDGNDAEAVLLREGLSQIVREKETEREVLGDASRGLHAHLINPGKSSSKALAEWVSFISSSKARSQAQIQRWIDDLEHNDADMRTHAAQKLYEEGISAASLALGDSWSHDAELWQAIGGPKFKFDAVGIAVENQSFGDIREVWGEIPLANIPDESLQVNEFVVQSGTARLDILTSKGGEGAIANYLKNNGQGIQQVEIFVQDVEMVTNLLNQKAAEGNGPKPVYPKPRPGAEGTLINFVLLNHPGGGKILIELVQKSRPESAGNTAFQKSGEALTSRQDALVDRAILSYFDDAEGARYGFKNEKPVEAYALQDPEIYAKLDPDGKLRTGKTLIYVFDDFMFRLQRISKVHQVDVPWGLITHPSTRFGAKLYMDLEHLDALLQLPENARREWAAHEAAHLENPAAGEEEIQKSAPVENLIKEFKKYDRKKVGQYIRLLTKGDRLEKYVAMRSLRKYGKLAARAIPRIIEIAEDEVEAKDNRLDAVDTLGVIGKDSAEVVRALVRLKEREDPKTHLSKKILLVLGYFSADSEQLLNVFKDVLMDSIKDEMVRVGARALSRPGKQADKARDILIEFLADKENSKAFPKAYEEAVKSVGVLGVTTPASVRALFGALELRNRKINLAALAALRHILYARPDLIKVITEAAETSPRATARSFAVELLGRERVLPAETLKVLEKIAENPKEQGFTRKLARQLVDEAASHDPGAVSALKTLKNGKTPFPQLVITRNARIKYDLQGPLYQLIDGPDDIRQINYSHPGMEAWLRNQGFYKHELVWLGVLHEARHEAIRQINDQYELIDELKENLEAAFEGPQGLKNFLKSFYLEFPEPDLHQKILESKADSETLEALAQSYLNKAKAPESPAAGLIDQSLEEMLSRTGGIELAVEEVLVRVLESRNQNLRNHPLLESPFYETRAFRIAAESMQLYFRETAAKGTILGHGLFAGQPLGLGLLEFAGTENLENISIRDQLRNAHRAGFNLRGIDASKVKASGKPAFALVSGKAAELVINRENPLVQNAAAAREILSAAEEWMNTLTQTLPQGALTLTVSDAGLQAEGSSLSKALNYQILRDWLSQLGSNHLTLPGRENVTAKETLDLFNWLALAVSISKSDIFSGKAFDLKANFESRVAQRQKQAKEINVKALTLSQIEQDFLDASTREMIGKELENGVRYVLIAEKGQKEEDVREKLTRSNFDLKWLQNGKIIILNEIDSETQTVNVDSVINQTKQIWGLDEKSFKAYVQDPENTEEASNFALAVPENMKLTGNVQKVRYFRARKGVRLSETLTFLHGLLTAPLKVVVQQMKEELLANGFSQDDIDELLSMEGDVLIPPIQSGSLVNRLIEEKKAAEMVSWSA